MAAVFLDKVQSRELAIRWLPREDVELYHLKEVTPNIEPGRMLLNPIILTSLPETFQKS